MLWLAIVERCSCGEINHILDIFDSYAEWMKYQSEMIRHGENGRRLLRICIYTYIYTPEPDKPV